MPPAALSALAAMSAPRFRYEAAGVIDLRDKLCVKTYSDGIALFVAALCNNKTGVLQSMDEIDRVGFKTVLAKGFYGIHELTEEVQDAMREYMVVAPAHNGPYLEAIAAVRAVLPSVPFIGAFETAFHTTVPIARKLYGVPYEWYEKYGVEKLGYHGASHSYVSETVSAMRGGATGRLISCHLGGSGSLCAILNGTSVDTSFGLSLQTGVIQSNRVGDLDSFIIPYMVSRGFTLDEVTETLKKRGGLLGISGVSNDLRDIEEAMTAGNERAKLAFDVFVTGIVRYIGAYYAELGGLDALAFAGGIGENSSLLRNAVCKATAHMGTLLDEEKNGTRGVRGIISKKDSPVTVYVVATDEEVVVAKKTFEYKR